MKITPVLLAGGMGRRLWPLSSDNLPKQLLPLYSSKTALQETVLRFCNQDIYSKPLVICADKYIDEIQKQLDDINVDATIISEPAQKGTACAAIIAALYVDNKNTDNLILLTPCDHIIDDISILHNSISNGASSAQKNKIVTFGITPPDYVDNVKTGYGYIKSGDKISDHIYEIEQFIEKPDIPYAHQLLAQGDVYYNSGMFLFAADFFINEARLYNNETTSYCIDALQNASIDGDNIILNAHYFANIKPDTIDYAIIEQTKHIVVVEFNGGWRDIGSYLDLWQAGEKDESNNVLKGDVQLAGVSRSYVRCNTKQKVIAIDIEDLIVSVTDDAILISSKNNVDKIKDIC